MPVEDFRSKNARYIAVTLPNKAGYRGREEGGALTWDGSISASSSIRSGLSQPSRALVALASRLVVRHVSQMNCCDNSWAPAKIGCIEYAYLNMTSMSAHRQVHLIAASCAARAGGRRHEVMASEERPRVAAAEARAADIIATSGLDFLHDSSAARYAHHRRRRANRITDSLPPHLHHLRRRQHLSDSLTWTFLARTARPHNSRHGCCNSFRTAGARRARRRPSSHRCHQARFHLTAYAAHRRHLRLRSGHIQVFPGPKSSPRPEQPRHRRQHRR